MGLASEACRNIAYAGGISEKKVLVVFQLLIHLTLPAIPGRITAGPGKERGIREFVALLGGTLNREGTPPEFSESRLGLSHVLPGLVKLLLQLFADQVGAGELVPLGADLGSQLGMIFAESNAFSLEFLVTLEEVPGLTRTFETKILLPSYLIENREELTGVILSL